MKLHLKIFRVLLFLLPLQIGKHFWPDWSLVFGIRVDYLSPVIYLTDILVLTLLLVWLGQNFREIGGFLVKKKIYIFLIGALFLANVLVAQHPTAAILRWAKIFEVLVFSFYVFWEREKTVNLIYKTIPLTLFYLAPIAVLQFYFQRTIGGPLYFLGERSFSVSTPGIALVDLWGKSFMRPYTIFPHPNALAGYALVATLIAFFQKEKRGLLFFSEIFFGLFVILISFSQNAWISLLLIIALKLIGKKTYFYTTLLVFVLSLALLFPINLSLFSLSFFGESFSKRLELSRIAGIIFAKRPFLGIGLNNLFYLLPSFQNRVSWWLQPIHNIYLLVLTETGFLGFSYFYFFVLRPFVKKKNLPFLIFLLAIILTGFSDHYWLTAQQNLLLFGIVVGGAYSWN